MSEETIVAIATPPGRGGVGIVRLSGPQALSIAYQQSSLSQQQNKLIPRHAVYAHLLDIKTQEMIDDGIILYFKGPHSFTGEDVVELQCHGSPVVLDRLIAQSVSLGARIARPGEFSQRAFLNDKMDLTQAEAVSDLINASSQTAARMAVKSLQGDFSKAINELNEQIIYLRLYIEATIDFSEEEIDFIAEGKIALKLTEILATLQKIREHAVQGVLLREGLSVVIAGPPNAGKSTLINRLAARDIAIVTDIPGTTRDVMREQIMLDDLPLQIIDTAGLRESEDIVEREGIKRAMEEVKHADCILWVTDVQHQSRQEETILMISPDVLSSTPIIHVINKIDVVACQILAQDNQVYLSALTGEGMEILKEKIKNLVGYQPSEGLFLARRRHLQALDVANESLHHAKQHLSGRVAAELLAEDLRLAHHALSEITGEFTSDDLLGKIFSTFCIGK